MTFELIVFWYWSNIVLPHVDFEKKSNKLRDEERVCKVLLVIACIYFATLEFTAIVRRRWGYFNSVPRLFNIITPVLIMVNVWEIFDTKASSYWTIQTWAALAIWFRFMIYLRTINSFSWVISMIISLANMQVLTFAVILLIGIMAFSDAFKSIDKSLELAGFIEPP